jgi:PTH1 family peptidyl-tRNA hydrolase
MATSIQLIVGLGNPGAQYEGSRHNAGADFVHELLRRHGGILKAESRFFGNVGEILIDNRRVRLLVPDTFMNLSGKSVAALAGFYKIDPAQMLIAHDELDMPAGVARFKFDGGHGGHNGLRDVIPALGNRRDFHRLRIGIGHPGSARQVSGYVLGRPSAADRQAIDAAIDEAVRALPLLLEGDATKAMTRLHSFSAVPEAPADGAP